jgi:signal transduction histidine kinase
VNWNKYGFLLLTSVAMLTLLFDFTFSTWGAGLFHNLFSIAYISGIVLVALSLAEKISSANRTGIIYLIAVSPLILQVLVVILARWRLFTLPVDTSLSMTIAILVEIIILTLGLTIRYNYFKVEKDKLENALAWQRKITVEKVLAAQEEERRRVASDLHDGLGGTLASVKGMLSAISQSHSDRTLEKLIDSQNLLDKACDDLRYIAHDLMPADFSNTSLHLAVEELVSKLYGSSEIEFSYVLGGKHRLLDKYLELNIYRILNELVHNIRKHSNATRAIVQLIYHDDFLQLMVEDNGRGFDTRSTEPDAGIGLKNIQSRIEYINAKIYFDSSKLGTTVTCNVPYPI